MEKAIIFNIQRYSLNDGPGIRTTVFFKGCPLNCWWCHNPESQDYSIRIIKDESKCINCLNCQKINVPDVGVIEYSPAEICPTEAIKQIGQYYTVEELFKIIKKDILFYEESGGGVTFSGGEPLSQPEFLIKILKKCKENGIHTTVDTSGYASEHIIKQVAQYTDLWLYDLKHLDEAKHIELTGVTNKKILNNLKLLSTITQNVWVRVPIIPTCNNESTNIKALGEFLNKEIGLFNINILPYHTLAEDKHSRFKMAYKLKYIVQPSDDEMNSIKLTLESYGLNVTIGG